jgi:hypothetical protein
MRLSCAAGEGLLLRGLELLVLLLVVLLVVLAVALLRVGLGFVFGLLLGLGSGLLLHLGLGVVLLLHLGICLGRRCRWRQRQRRRLRCRWRRRRLHRRWPRPRPLGRRLELGAVARRRPRGREQPPRPRCCLRGSRWRPCRRRRPQGRGLSLRLSRPVPGGHHAPEELRGRLAGPELEDRLAFVLAGREGLAGTVQVSGGAATLAFSGPQLRRKSRAGPLAGCVGNSVEAACHLGYLKLAVSAEVSGMAAGRLGGSLVWEWWPGRAGFVSCGAWCVRWLCATGSTVMWETSFSSTWARAKGVSSWTSRPGGRHPTQTA